MRGGAAPAAPETWLASPRISVANCRWFRARTVDSAPSMSVIVDVRPALAVGKFIDTTESSSHERGRRPTAGSRLDPPAKYGSNMIGELSLRTKTRSSRFLWLRQSTAARCLFLHQRRILCCFGLRGGGLSSSELKRVYSEAGFLLRHRERVHGGIAPARQELVTVVVTSCPMYYYNC